MGFSGGGRLVRSVALRRARLWQLPDADLYKQAFLRGRSVGAPAWAAVSEQLLADWSVPDWPSRPADATGYEQYKRLITSLLAQQCHSAWSAEASRRTSSIV